MALQSIQWQPSDRQLRQFAVCAACVLTLLLGWYQVTGWVWVSTVCGGVLCGLAVLRPQWLKPLFVILSLVAFPIGFVVSEMVLLVLFLGVMLPLGWFRRAVLGHDPLALKPDPNAVSYWKRRKNACSLESYFRQF